MEDFILRIPKWKGELRFDYGMVSFLLIWIVLFTAIMLCIWGYKYFQGMCFLTFESLCGVVGLIAAESMTDNPVLKMFFFIMFVFLGICLFYFLSTMCAWVLNRLGAGKVLCKMEYLFAALSGSIVAGITVYQKIYHNFRMVAGATLLLAVLSILHGHRATARRKPFYTYEDLRRLKPQAEVQQNA